MNRGAFHRPRPSNRGHGHGKTSCFSIVCWLYYPPYSLSIPSQNPTQYQVFKEVSNLWGFSSIFPSILDCPKTWWLGDPGIPPKRLPWLHRWRAATHQRPWWKPPFFFVGPPLTIAFGWCQELQELTMLYNFMIPKSSYITMAYCGL